MALLVKAGGGENVTPQVETYETLLETAIANLAGKAFVPPVKDGQYVWKKYGKVVPEGYTQVEYIESTGTQYIDTGFKPNQDTGVTIDFQLNVASDWQCIFGARAGSNTKSYSLWHTGSAFGFYYSSANGTFSNLDRTARHNIVATKNNAIANGASSVSLAYSSFTSNYSLYLFAVNTDLEAESYTSMKLYSCQIYDNGTLVRDYIPCKNSSGTIGLYDLVNNVFYSNAGTGVFVAGAVVAGTFEDYVVSDDETAYPDGGEQDGYYYIKFDPATLLAENIREGVDIWGVLGTMSEGVSGIDYGEVTLTAKNRYITIAHKLGKVPQFCGIIIVSKSGGFANDVHAEFYPVTIDGEKNTFRAYNWQEGASTSILPTLSANNVKFDSGALESFAIGTYYWFVKA